MSTNRDTEPLPDILYKERLNVKSNNYNLILIYLTFS